MTWPNDATYPTFTRWTPGVKRRGLEVSRVNELMGAVEQIRAVLGPVLPDGAWPTLADRLAELSAGDPVDLAALMEAWDTAGAADTLTAGDFLLGVRPAAGATPARAMALPLNPPVGFGVANTTQMTSTTQPNSAAYVDMTAQTGGISLTNPYAVARVAQFDLSVCFYAKTSTTSVIPTFGLCVEAQVSEDGGSTWTPISPMGGDERHPTFASAATNVSVATFVIRRSLTRTIAAGATKTFQTRCRYATDGSASAPASGMNYVHGRTLIEGVWL